MAKDRFNGMSKDAPDGHDIACGLLEENRPQRMFTKIQDVDESLTFWGAVGSLVMTMVGSGLVAFPHAIALCGYIGSVAVMTITVALSHMSYCAVLRCTRTMQLSSYDGLLSMLPMSWSYSSKVGLGVLLSLAVTTYIIVAANTVSAIAVNLSSDASVTSNYLRFAIIIAAMLPLCLTRTISALANLSMFCFACVILLALLVVCLCTSPLIVPVERANLVAQTSSEQLLRAVPIFASSLFGHMNFPRIYAELQPQAKPRAEAVSLTACSMLAILYLAIGLAGYSTFGESVQDDIVAALAIALGESYIIVVMQALSMTFVILKTPLIVYPMRQLLLAYLRPGVGLDSLSIGTNFALSALILAFIYCLANFLPDLSIVLTILGAVCCIPLTYIYPARLLYASDPSSCWQSFALGIVGVLASCLSIYVAMM